MNVILSSYSVLEQPATIKGLKTVVIRDDFDNPIFIAIQQNESNIWALTPDNPRFAAIVKELGITKRLKVELSLNG